MGTAKDSIDLLVANSALFDQVINGDQNALVTVRSGQVKSVMKAINDAIAAVQTLGVTLSQNPGAVAIIGGAIDGTPIGQTTPAAVAGTSGLFNTLASKTVTKTIAAGASADLVSIGSYSSELAGFIHIRSVPPAAGRLTSAIFAVDTMGSGADGIASLTHSTYGTGSPYTLSYVVNQPVAGTNKLTLTNNDTVSVGYYITYSWMHNDGASYL